MRVDRLSPGFCFPFALGLLLALWVRCGELRAESPPGPVIIAHPKSAYVTPGQKVVLEVVARGTEPLSYQWYQTGFVIPGATLSTYTIPAFGLPDMGGYRVTVRDGLGRTVSSDFASLEILEPVTNRPIPFHRYLKVSTAAGAPGERGDRTGPAALARFSSPRAGAFGSDGALYFSDTANHRIKKLLPSGSVVEVAGTGQPGDADGLAASSQFRDPGGLRVAADGTILVADSGNHRIRRISPDGRVTTWAGTGTPGSTDGPGSTAQFRQPADLALDVDGSIYVADSLNHTLRRIDATGNVQTWSGTGSPGTRGGPRASAQWNEPSGIEFLPSRELVVAEAGTPWVRRIAQNDQVEVVAGSLVAGFQDGAADQARFAKPVGIAVDGGGNLFVADQGNHALRRISAYGMVHTVSGTGTAGSENSEMEVSRFNQPSGLALDTQGNLFVADSGNHLIRRLERVGALSHHYLTLVSDHPVAFWRMNWEDMPAGFIQDVTGRHPGQYFGNRSWGPSDSIVSPLANTAYSGNVSFSIVQIPFHAALNPDAFAAELWVSMHPLDATPLSDQAVFSSADRQRFRGWRLRANAVRDWELLIGNGRRWVPIEGPPVDDSGRWTHITITSTGSRIRLFVDGQLAASRDIAFLPNQSEPLYIGPAPGEVGGHATFDEVALFPFALSPAQVFHHALAGRNPEVLTAAHLGARVMLYWFTGQLEAAPSPAGPWSAVPDARSPYVADGLGSHGFYRTATP